MNAIAGKMRERVTVWYRGQPTSFSGVLLAEAADEIDSLQVELAATEAQRDRLREYVELCAGNQHCLVSPAMHAKAIELLAALWPQSEPNAAKGGKE